MIYCRLTRTSPDGIGRGNQAAVQPAWAGRQAASRPINSNPFVLILPARERGCRLLLGRLGARPSAYTPPRSPTKPHTATLRRQATRRTRTYARRLGWHASSG